MLMYEYHGNSSAGVHAVRPLATEIKKCIATRPNEAAPLFTCYKIIDSALNPTAYIDSQTFFCTCVELKIFGERIRKSKIENIKLKSLHVFCSRVGLVFQ